ncbi:MAG: hypothetical protein V3U89_00695 [Methylophilaceae bacterium]
MSPNKNKPLSNRRDFLKKSLLVVGPALSFNPLSLLAANTIRTKKSNGYWMLASHRIHPMTKLIPFHSEKYRKSTSAVFTKTPDYPISKLKLSFSNWATLSSGIQEPEIDGVASIKVKGALFINGTLFTTLTFKGSTETNVSPGEDVWCDEVNVPKWISQDVEVRTYCETKSGTPRLASYRNRQGNTRDAVVFDANDETHLALLSGQKNEVPFTKYSTYFYGPSLMVSDGWDGRNVVLCVGDSIGYGDNFGVSWLTNGINDEQGLRLPYANFCVQGTRASGQSSLEAGAYRRKARLLKSINPNSPTVMPFTCVISQMGVNDSWGTDGKKLLGKMQVWWAFIKKQWPDTMLIQTTYTPRCSKDKINFYTSYASQQSVTTTPPETDRWYVADIIKATPSPIDHYIDVREAWTGSKKGYLWRELGYNGKLISDIPVGESLCLVDIAPPIGSAIVFSAGSNAVELPYAVVTRIEGNGPYRVAFSKPVKKSHAIGSSVKITMSADGVHPFGGYANKFASLAVINFKVKHLLEMKKR